MSNTEDAAGQDHADEARMTYTRVLNAPRELVFECMTKPDHLTAFWGPDGTRTPLDGITVELRPGGRFETLMINDAGGSYRMAAVFTEVAAPERVSWVEPATGMSTTVTFTETARGSTELRIDQRRVPPALREPAARAGFLTSLDRLDLYLKQLKESET